MSLRKHITDGVNGEGQCVSYCPACGPVCKHGDNSYECVLCQVPTPDQGMREALEWIAEGHYTDSSGDRSGHPGYQRVGADARNVARDALAALSTPQTVTPTDADREAARQLLAPWILNHYDRRNDDQLPGLAEDIETAAQAIADGRS